MLTQQQTIKHLATFSGIGINTGSQVTMTWKPAPVDHGISLVTARMNRGISRRSCQSAPDKSNRRLETASER